MCRATDYSKLSLFAALRPSLFTSPRGGHCARNPNGKQSINRDDVVCVSSYRANAMLRRQYSGNGNTPPPPCHPPLSRFREWLTIYPFFLSCFCSFFCYAFSFDPPVSCYLTMLDYWSYRGDSSIVVCSELNCWKWRSLFGKLESKNMVFKITLK